MQEGIEDRIINNTSTIKENENKCKPISYLSKDVILRSDLSSIFAKEVRL